MKQYKIFLFAAVFVLFAASGFAQAGKTTFNLNYSVNAPLGNFKDNVISKTSFRGWNASLLYGISDRISIGLQSGSNYFQQGYPRQVYNTKDGDISAVLTNSVQVVPIQAKIRYNLAPGAFLQPYIGVGAGGNIITFNQYLGEFGSGKSGFNFSASPEAGVLIPFSRSGASGITIGADYNYMPFKYGDIKSLDNWGVYAGVKFPLGR